MLRFMRELRGAEVVTVDYVPTDKNPADIFTKALPRPLFIRLRDLVFPQQPLPQP